MSIDLEKVSKLTGFVDKLIQIKDMETILDESVVGEMIDQAITISGASYTNEEKEAAKRDITWKYQIFATPGQSILEDYEQDNWYDDRKAEIEPKFWTRYKNYLVIEFTIKYTVSPYSDANLLKTDARCNLQ